VGAKSGDPAAFRQAVTTVMANALFLWTIGSLLETSELPFEPADALLRPFDGVEGSA
jgi:hypothetical protein